MTPILEQTTSNAQRENIVYLKVLGGLDKVDKVHTYIQRQIEYSKLK